MARPVVHFEIAASDTSRSRTFYGQLFDWQIQQHEGMDYHLVAQAGQNSIGGGIGATQPGQHPSVTFYVQVDDLQACLDRAEKLGGKTILAPTPIPDVGTCAMLADPDGIVIGLFKGN